MSLDVIYIYTLKRRLSWVEETVERKKENGLKSHSVKNARARRNPKLQRVFEPGWYLPYRSARNGLFSEKKSSACSDKVISFYSE